MFEVCDVFDARGQVGRDDIGEAAEALAEVMEERRAKPLYGPPDGMASHSMATVRLLAAVPRWTTARAEVESRTLPLPGRTDVRTRIGGDPFRFGIAIFGSVV